VLDIGANTGHFSEIAARGGARVTAIDRDAVVVGETWRRAARTGLDILPLVVNLANPSPGAGWRNREFPSFLERARGAFDMVLMLATVHHLMAGDGVPVEEIVGLVAECTTKWAVIEYVGPEDEMFRRVARGRDALWGWLTPAAFEAAWRREFEIVRGVGDGGRRVYLMRRARSE
jgi:SAM-dependent methyltransferase